VHTEQGGGNERLQNRAQRCRSTVLNVCGGGARVGGLGRVYVEGEMGGDS
jgi:hypothetical protein